MQFNERLKKLRTESGLTQSELAARVYVSRSAVAKWEAGLGLPNEESLCLLAQCFHIAPDKLLTDTETETVIVEKNSALSRRKTLIILLSILLAFFFTVGAVLAIYFAYFYNPYTLPRIPTRALIFETEKGIDYEKLTSYSFEELSPEKEFSGLRTFVLSEDEVVIQLPRLLVMTTDGDSFIYEDVQLSGVIVARKGEMTVEICEDGSLCITLSTVTGAFEGYLNLQYGDLILSAKIERPAIPIRRIDLWLEDGTREIGLNDIKGLFVQVVPDNANQSDFVIEITKITQWDGTVYDGDLSEYAVIKMIETVEWETGITEDEDAYVVITTEKLAVGAKIHIVARALFYDIISEELVIEVR
ncbi:MAG: helix-turn-helix transcriptional regulator [Clostridiales bacterium]|nr:helix-turn-helix transcriptional regulator [Clostridiales bacterium]